MVLVVMVFQCCVTTLPSCGVGGNGVSVLCNHQVVVLVVMVFQCCLNTLPSCGVGGNGVSVLCNQSAKMVFQCCVTTKLWCWW